MPTNVQGLNARRKGPTRRSADGGFVPAQAMEILLEIEDDII